MIQNLLLNRYKYLRGKQGMRDDQEEMEKCTRKSAIYTTTPSYEAVNGVPFCISTRVKCINIKLSTRPFPPEK